MGLPKVDFCFSGWVRDAEIDTVVITATGEKLDVSERAAKEITEKLESGEWSIALGDHLYECGKADISMFDFAASED